MSEEFGPDFITITDEDVNDIELELVDALEHNGQTYMAFFPAVEEDGDEEGEEYATIRKNAKVVYVEKHLGLGAGNKVLNPKTVIFMEENSSLEMQTVQLGGVNFSNRNTKATLNENAKLVCIEKILTDENQIAKTNFNINLKGKNSSVKVTSRSVAKGKSYQKFVSNIDGNNECFGHVECDGIIIDNAIIESAPKVCAKHPLASLVHEAAIGKIAGDQLIKLQTLGLTEQ